LTSQKLGTRITLLHFICGLPIVRGNGPVNKCCTCARTFHIGDRTEWLSAISENNCRSWCCSWCYKFALTSQMITPRGFRPRTTVVQVLYYYIICDIYIYLLYTWYNDNIVMPIYNGAQTWPKPHTKYLIYIMIPRTDL